MGVHNPHLTCFLLVVMTMAHFFHPSLPKPVLQELAATLGPLVWDTILERAGEDVKCEPRSREGKEPLRDGEAISWLFLIPPWVMQFLHNVDGERPRQFMRERIQERAIARYLRMVEEDPNYVDDERLKVTDTRTAEDIETWLKTSGYECLDTVSAADMLLQLKMTGQLPPDSPAVPVGAVKSYNENKMRTTLMKLAGQRIDPKAAKYKVMARCWKSLLTTCFTKGTPFREKNSIALQNLIDRYMEHMKGVKMEEIYARTMHFELTPEEKMCLFNGDED